ncbi:MAG: CoA transferase [Dehalobacterium sp.]
MDGPLKGIRVLDLTRVLAGPFCTLQLADMGAEVIKIERPEYGDDTHFFGPFKNGESGYFIMLNRGKKGITLDFKKPKAVEIFKKMVEHADVVVENFKPGVMNKLGIGYEELKKINPRIIYAAISGFGQYGPYWERPGYDIVAQAMGGLMSITGFPDNPPTRVGSSVGDLSAGIYGALAIMMALYAREKTGKGQLVDIALMDAIFSFCETNVVRYTIGNIIPKRVGSRHPLSAPFDIYQAKDGYVVIAVANEPLMEKLFDLMGKPELHLDPRFETDAKRSEHDQELKEIIETWLSQYTVGQAVEIMLTHAIPSSPVLTIPQVCADPHINAREMLVEIDHPIAGRVKIPGTPMKLAETPAHVTGTAPTLGQHNEEILTELLGCNKDTVRQLQEEGVI